MTLTMPGALPLFLFCGLITWLSIYINKKSNKIATGFLSFFTLNCLKTSWFLSINSYVFVNLFSLVKVSFVTTMEEKLRIFDEIWFKRINNNPELADFTFADLSEKVVNYLNNPTDIYEFINASMNDFIHSCISKKKEAELLITPENTGFNFYDYCTWNNAIILCLVVGFGFYIFYYSGSNSVLPDRPEIAANDLTDVNLTLNKHYDYINDHNQRFDDITEKLNTLRGQLSTLYDNLALTDKTIAKNAATCKTDCEYCLHSVDDLRLAIMDLIGRGGLF